jgi:hypothetical protein
VGYNKGSVKRKVYSHEHTDQKIRKVSNNLMMHLRFLEKQEQTIPKVVDKNKL